jgi:hypothetical protein
MALAAATVPSSIPETRNGLDAGHPINRSKRPRKGPGETCAVENSVLRTEGEEDPGVLRQETPIRRPCQISAPWRIPPEPNSRQIWVMENYIPCPKSTRTMDKILGAVSAINLAMVTSGSHLPIRPESHLFEVQCRLHPTTRENSGFISLIFHSSNLLTSLHLMMVTMHSPRYLFQTPETDDVSPVILNHISPYLQYLSVRPSPLIPLTKHSKVKYAVSATLLPGLLT